MILTLYHIFNYRFYNSANKLADKLQRFKKYFLLSAFCRGLCNYSYNVI
jgi:hypothetical protein